MSNYCMNNCSQGMRKAAMEKYRAINTKCSSETECMSETTSFSDMSRTVSQGMNSMPCCSMPIAMAYVPKQKYGSLFDLNKALKVGTIFPELCKPFCGKGGGC